MKTKPYADTTLDYYSLSGIARVATISYNSESGDETRVEVLCFDKIGELYKNQMQIGGRGFDYNNPDAYSVVLYTVKYKSGKPLIDQIELDMEDKKQTEFVKDGPPKPAFLNSKLLK